MDLYAMENTWRARGRAMVCGVDEAGRGPLAGPVYAAAVILPPGLILPGLDDSKKLLKQRREALFDEITSKAVSYCVSSATVAEIESLNILEASQLAMRRAVDGLASQPDIVLVDGNIARGFTRPTVCVTGGDATCAAIAAASVLAKVSRDAYMLELAARYPEYGFERHMGYGTALHKQRLLEHGPCPEHRKLFLRKILKNENTLAVGHRGEDQAVQYLRTLGYEVLARNYRSRYGELDIIARDGEWVVFVEVKTRKDDSFAAAASAVTPSKREKMRKTASLWLKYIKSEAPARFDVIEVYAEGRINHIPHAFM